MSENFTNEAIDFNAVYVPSDQVVARDIEDEFLLVPIASGIGDLEDALYTLNDTGREIWRKLDQGKKLGTLVDELLEEFNAPREVISADVEGIMRDLLKLRMVERLA